MTVTIVEKSWCAKIAAWKLHADKVAMVIGKKIYLHNVSREEFLRNKKWVRHEVAHVKQWARFGKLRFAFLYLLESFNKGYHYNKFEVEARNKESDPLIMKGIEIK
jgi:hypothetical protein